MEPTIENQDFMFFAPPDLAAPFATKVLDKLRQPGVSDSFSLNSLRLMRQRWAQNRQEACGWSRLQQHCIGEGIIEIFLKFANVKNSSQERDFASYYALDSIQFFILNASGTERHRIFQLLKQHDFLQVCISKLDHSPLILHRYSAANSIRTFILHCPFGEWLSATQTAELLEKLSRWMLVSTDRDAEELRHETNVWQTTVFAGRVLPPHAATKYARRWASMSADHLMWSSYGLLCRIPAPSRDFVLKAIQHRPVIFDLLYQCSSLPRPAWHPDIEANAAAIETLALIMQFPLTSIPHLEIPLDNSYIAQYQNDLGTSVKIMEVFTSNSSWAQKLIDLWSQYDNENPETIVDLLDKLTVDWYAAQPPEAGEIMQSMRRRGAFKIASMRIIANATYVKNLKDTDVLSLLRVSYLASRKIESLDNIRPDGIVDIALWEQDNHDLMRSPILGHQSIRSDSDAEPAAHLPCTELIGPIALLRLLTRLAERGLIMQSQSWTQLPEGTSSSTTLQDIKQILEPTVLKKILAIAVKRISRFREYIRDRVQKGLYHTALINYIPLAELALSVLEFDRMTGGTFANATCGARKELVLCLGNAAEMAIRKGLNDDALRLAAAANFYGAGAPREEKIPVEVVEKNKRRLAEAKRVLNID